MESWNGDGTPALDRFRRPGLQKKGNGDKATGMSSVADQPHTLLQHNTLSLDSPSSERADLAGTYTRYPHGDACFSRKGDR